MSTLLAFIPAPTYVEIDRLFESKFNRYQTRDTRDLWTPTENSRAKTAKKLTKSRTLSNVPSAAPAAAASGGTRRFLVRQASSFSSQFGKGGLRARGGSSNRIGPAMNASRHGKSEYLQVLKTCKKRAHWRVLEHSIDGYDVHLLARYQLEGPGYETSFTDLLMWAVLSGQHQIASLLWTKTLKPLRAAVLASQVCLRLSDTPQLRPDHDHLIEESIKYEQLALDLLDAVRESEDAFELITLCPWEWTDKVNGNGGGSGRSSRWRRILKWTDSVLETALFEDGDTSVPCKEFCAHRHSQYALEKFFAGDYPGSKARIPIESGLFAIFIQALISLLIPGLIIEVDPVSHPPNVRFLAGPQAEADHLAQAQTDRLEIDPDLVQAADELDKAAKRKKQISEGSALQGVIDKIEDEVDDIKDDFRAARGLHYYLVPKVVFTVHFVALIAYLAFSTYLLFVLYMGIDSAQGGGGGTGTNAQAGSPPPSANTPSAMGTLEIVWVVWSLARASDEVSDLGAMNRESFRLYTRDAWNQVDVLITLLLVAIVSLRVIVRAEELAFLEGLSPSASGGGVAVTDAHLAGFDPEAFAPAVWARNLYAIIVMLSYLRLLQFLRYYKALGVLAIVLNNMIRDVLNFIAILLVFTLGFGFAVAVVTKGETLGMADGHQVGAELVMGKQPIWSTWWGMVRVLVPVPLLKRTPCRLLRSSLPSSLLASIFFKLDVSALCRRPRSASAHDPTNSLV